MDWFAPVPTQEAATPPRPFSRKVCSRPENPPGWLLIICSSPPTVGLAEPAAPRALFLRSSIKLIQFLLRSVHDGSRCRPLRLLGYDHALNLVVGTFRD